MIWPAMNIGWTYGVPLLLYASLILILGVHGCRSLNSEGLVLLHFRAILEFDPSEVLGNWNPDDHTPCTWQGIHCVDGHVDIIDLNGLRLEGLLAPELGNLSHLRVLDLSKNRFHGAIPPEFGQLRSLQTLNLRDNKLTGMIPTELGRLNSLETLLLSNNRLEGSIPLEIKKLNLRTDLQFDEIPSTVAGGGASPNRKIGQCIWALHLPERSYPFLIAAKGITIPYYELLQLFKIQRKMSHSHADDSHINLTDSPKSSVIWNVGNGYNSMRRILAEESSNLAALPAPPNFGDPALQDPAADLPSRSSGSFPAIPNNKKLPLAPSASPGAVNQPMVAKSSAAEKSGNSMKPVVWISVLVFLLIIIAVVIVICRSRAARKLRPWKTGLSGQLQQAFVTGVPKLNREELEIACEDFSNIICTINGVATVYKGTLSSGVEIAVVSTTLTSLKDWSKNSDLVFRKKIDSLSQVNHKNFLNLIGFCEEDEPFTRMMVFEYAPNGTLSEHLHVEDLEHLDWNARMRVIMGTAYCLQHMHELNPPVTHFNLTSQDIILTDDFAAKISDMCFWKELVASSKKASENESRHSELPSSANLEANIYSFGVVLLEIISGRPPYRPEQGHLIDWGAPYLNDKNSLKKLADPTLESVNEKMLEVVCKVIQSCTQPNERGRPSMNEVVQELVQVIPIAPEAATPRLSPLWWAELEILSAEAP